MSTAGLKSIRNAVSSSMAGLVRRTHEIGVSADDLHAFAHGRKELPVDAISKIVGHLWSGMFLYDHRKDVLVSKNTSAPLGLGIMPEQQKSAKPYPNPLNNAQCLTLTPEKAADAGRRVAAYIRGGMTGTERSVR